MTTNQTSNRTAALNEAALLLLSVGPADAARTAAVRALLAPLSADPAEPDWVRQALATAVELLDSARDGEVDHGALTSRVGALIELVMQGATEDSPWGDATQFMLPPDAARELFPEFVAESLDYFDQIERALLRLEAKPDDTEAVNVVFRAFHTIKGTASFLGLEPICALAHSAESLLVQLRDGAVTFDGACADITLDCADMLRDLLVQSRGVIDGGSFTIPAAYAPLLQRIGDLERRIAAGGDRTAPGAPTVPAAQVPEVPETPRRRWDDSERGASMRVRTERLDTLVNLIGELVVAHSMVAQDAAVEQDRHGPLARKVAHSGKIVRELQTLGMTLRMVPLGPVFQRMQRLARDVAKEAGKRVEFIAAGVDTEIDRNMVDFITDPLVHMIRNAVDHGIEPPAERALAGKDETGILRLSASHEAGDVVVELRDDGRGLDHGRIVASALAKGLIDRERELSSAEICNLIFAPGLSTAGTVTALSGRGVGMDVVRRNIEALRGRIEISSAPGQGTTFTMRLPLTLAIADGMLVRVGSERYIVPTSSIHMSFRPAPGDITAVAGAGELVTLHGTVLPIVRLHELFSIDDALLDPAQGLLVVIGHGDARYAVLVDELLGQQQFVVKPVGDALGAVPGVAGAAILGDGSVGLILDPGGIIASL
ncbi:MAG TPA: chemotaxis protein CheA [Longimicrobiales bacterium]|nr:chemotaxis protein CheA [Longimicrobiales bacterium]